MKIIPNRFKSGGGKKQTSAPETAQPQILVTPSYIVSSDNGAVERIQQNIRRASSKHSELATSWPDETAENLVTRLLAAFDKVKDEKIELTRKLQTESEAKLQAETWAQAKEQLLDREKASNQQQLENLKTDHQRQMGIIRSNNQREVDALKSSHQRQMGTLNANHKRELETLKTSYQRQSETSKSSYQRQLESSHDAFKSAENEHNVHIEGLKLQFTHRERELHEKHEKEMVYIQQVNEDLKQALSAREHIKGLSDRELASQFKKLSTDVEDFSRIDWDPDREANWPYSEGELKYLYPRNVRKLKQHIVQNCLWLALYECVFRSPFRIIGEYGKAFDAELYEANSPAYDILEEDEKQEYNMKRHENAKVFLAALDSSDTSMANLHAIMHSYHHARRTVINSISYTMTKVTNLEHSERSALDNILQSAARLWLDACSQRYRLFVVMPDWSEDVLKLQRGDMNYLRLIIKPELQRFGNSRGDDMSKGELSAGWKSQVETYPLT